MTFLKRFTLCLLCIASLILISLSFSSCGDKYEDGILYNGNTVVGADKSATALSIKEGTTSISKNAFTDCKDLTSLTLPDSISDIAPGAFKGCDALVKTDNGISYVDGWVIGADENATSLTVADGTRGIARESFMGVTSLKDVVIPDSVKHIGARAFFRCSSLESITLPFIGKSSTTKNSMHFGYIFGAFNKEQNSEYVPDSLTSVKVTSATEIADYAFSSCGKITEVTLPNTLTSIGDYAFSKCTSLFEIIIPDSVASIGDRAFQNCASLSAVKLPENDGFKLLPEYAFAFCSSITSIIIPKSVSEIGACAIARCTNLESIEIKGACLERIGQQAFDGCKYLSSLDITVKLIDKAAFQNCIGLTDIKLGDGTLEIGSYAFNGCSGAVRISVPNSVTKIGEFAFYACHSLTSINLGENIKTIENSTFQNCINLKGDVIPSSVKSIGDNAFSGCNSLVQRQDGISYVNGWITEIFPSMTSINITDDVIGFANGAFSSTVNLSVINFNGSAEKWKEIEKTVPASVISNVNVVIK